MSDAYVIEAADTSAGIVIRERAGFRFFAASQRFGRLDGQLFKTIGAAERAIGDLSPRKPISLGPGGIAW
ncbi:MAG TPA: hypothetical protein VM689_06360 [Aliidongia sp.]|nr:hypothetical protein [Aliidongia sp.]